ncbi:hypothetical protein ALC57_10203 [Trachymyrmex cornetzi]|uniref:Uncharacterized protein n=1 Tax=Trachymyrmex cornetzi TaxID=471704 RepID=A0A151J4D3_9HYME|nr:hypothetical protein ALC57_10203 [Trachymyrmex cornetzi]
MLQGVSGEVLVFFEDPSQLWKTLSNENCVESAFVGAPLSLTRGLKPLSILTCGLLIDVWTLVSTGLIILDDEEEDTVCRIPQDHIDWISEVTLGVWLCLSTAKALNDGSVFLPADETRNCMTQRGTDRYRYRSLTWSSNAKRRHEIVSNYPSYRAVNINIRASLILGIE